MPAPPTAVAWSTTSNAASRAESGERSRRLGRRHPLMPFTWRSALTQWVWAPIPSALVLTAATVYMLGVWRVRRDHPARPWPWPKALSFFAGLGVIIVATQSSIGAYDGVLFWVHMWQHL